jgi:putative FmdB family regulatory protein
MPIYDYRCGGCRRRLSLLFRTFAAAEDPVCPHCGSRDLARLVTRFAVVRSEDSRLDDLADPAAFGDLDESDPRSVARWARRMGQEYGEDLGDDFGEIVDQMEAGELPDDADGGLMGDDSMMADGGGVADSFA